MNAEAALSLSPGQQLASARKAKGKSLADIAKATKIFETRLEAIERDDYSAAGTAPAFVVGYVKAYARQVDVPEKPLVRVLESYFKQRKLTESLEQQVPVIAKPSPARKYLPWLTTAAAIAVFLGLGQWFMQRQPAPLPTEVTQSSVVPALSERPELTKRDENLLREELSEPAQEVEVAPEIDPAIDDLAGNTASNTSGNAQVPAPAAIAEKVDAPVTASAHQPQNVAQAEDDTPASVQAAGNDELVLSFTGDCWLEIYDANGERITSRLAKADSRLTYTGAAPFNVKLGDATVASLSVNGRSVPLDIPPGRRVLRLQVGP